MHYFHLKNAHSYDRALAVLKFLSEHMSPVCRDMVLRFVASSYYSNLDYAIVRRENTSGLLRETISSFHKFQELTYPNIEVSVHFEDNNFYFLFSNLDVYNAEFAVTDIKTVQISSLPLPDLTMLYKGFYVKHTFFDVKRIVFEDFNMRDFRPSLDERAQKQIKIILQEQIIQKNKDISYQEMQTINSTVASSDNASLMDKIKNVLTKSDALYRKTNNL